MIRRCVQDLSILGTDLQVAINTKNYQSTRRIFFEIVQIVLPHLNPPPTQIKIPKTIQISKNG